MASTSSTPRRDEESEKNYDVFINHRGPDTKKILAIPLRESLSAAKIRAYVDKKDNELGDSIPSNIKAAIISASVHIAIFSRIYATSAWCLNELTLMLRTGVPIIPVFYNVKPADLRYAEDFSLHGLKERHPDKVDEWKASLVEVSKITGEEVIISQQNNIDLHKENIMSAVKRKLVMRHAPLGLEKLKVERRPIPLEVASYKVGVDELVQNFEMHCQELDPERGKMIGIFGPEGSGKTTLAKELFNRKCSEYTESSFLFNVGEAFVNGKLTSLQSKLLKDLFHTHLAVNDIGNGVIILQSKLKSLNRFLVVLDGVATPKEVNSLVPLYPLNRDSLVIVTASEESVLEKAGISVRYEIGEMDSENGKYLFSRHAFQEESTPGYAGLVERFVGMCGGLPLSLQLLGGHAFCMNRNTNTWALELDRIQSNDLGTLNIKSILELSYKALKYEEKEIFLDIACFFVNKEVEMGKRIWKASGWDAETALTNLRDRCLVDVVRQDLDEEPPTYVFRMLEVIREFGKEKAVSGDIKRVWCSHPILVVSNNFEDILAIARNDSFRCLNSISKSPMDITYFLGHSEESAILQWLEVKNNCIPPWIALQYLEALRISLLGVPKKLGESDPQASWKLRELRCMFKALRRHEKTALQENWREYYVFLGRLVELESLILKMELSEDGRHIEVQWYPFLEILASFSCLETLTLSGLYIDGEIGISNCTSLRKLESLTLSKVKLTSKVSISGECCPTLECLKIESMDRLSELDLEGVKTLKCLEVLKCHQMKRVSGSDMPKLEMLCIEDCSDVEELPHLMSMRNLKTISIIACEVLQVINGIECLSCLEDITIARCMKLRTLTRIENFEGLKSMILSDGCVCRFLTSFQRLPSKFTVVMGRATWPDLNQRQIGEAINRADSHCEFKSRDEGYQKLRSFLRSDESFGAIILCAMVASSGCTYMDRRPQFGRTIQLSFVQDEGEKLIYTIVVTDPNEILLVSHSIPRYCWMPIFDLQENSSIPLGVIEEGYILGINEGRECEILNMLIGTLY